MAARRGSLITAVLICAMLPRSEGIVGGREAVPHSRPYMASIQKQEGENMMHECGGFLVSDQWVMSAAHCFPHGLDGRKVVLGLHSLMEAEDTKQTFSILQLHKHPNFSRTYDNDIALLKLNSVIVASEAVKPVTYLRDGGVNPETGAEVETAGWGSVNNLEGRSDRLKELFIDIFRHGRCGRGDYYGGRLTSNMMCAQRLCQHPCSHSYKTDDTCNGDSGGPLLYNGVVVGITSNGGQKCGQLKKPGIYTIISHYTQWINSTMAL